MNFKALMDELRIDEGVYSFAVSPNGRRVAVGTRGILGLYEIQPSAAGGRLSHVASYPSLDRSSDDLTFIGLAFTADGSSLQVVCEDGTELELEADEKTRGVMQETIAAKAVTVVRYRGDRLVLRSVTERRSRLAQ